jgi:hypothetical protein
VEDLNTIRIDLNSKDSREVVENLLRAADAPGALIGRAKNGSTALMFRSNHPHAICPLIVGADHNQRVFNLATRDGETRLTIATDNPAQVDGYKWDRDVPRHEMHVMPYAAGDVAKRIVVAAFGLGLTWAEIVDRDRAVEERVAKFKADVAAGRIKLKTDEELQAERDADIVKAHEGSYYTQWDGPVAQEIIGARARHAARLAKQQAEHAAELQAVEDRKLLARVERGELPDYLQRVTDARRRQSERQGAAA